jgi:cell division protein FtsW (lipid II flippase)
MLLQSYFLITAMPLTCCSLIYRMRNGGLKQVLFCYVMSMLPLLVLHSMFGAVFMSVLVVTLLLVTAIRQGAFTALKYRRCTCGMLIFTTLADPLIVAAILRPEIMQRVLSPLLEHPDMAGYGYTAMLLREALAQARWLGPAENFAEMLFPFGGVDYLPVWLVCRFGWIAFLAILALLGAMCVFAMRIYRRQSGLLAKLVVCAVFGVWGVQALSALLVGFGVVFMFSYPFPFFGGNMALMFNAVLLGLLLSVCQVGTLGSAVENRPVITNGSLGMIRFEISRNRILLERRQKSGNDA